jgi:hypothetical protein
MPQHRQAPSQQQRACGCEFVAIRGRRWSSNAGAMSTSLRVVVRGSPRPGMRVQGRGEANELADASWSQSEAGAIPMSLRMVVRNRPRPGIVVRSRPRLRIIVRGIPRPGIQVRGRGEANKLADASSRLSDAGMVVQAIPRPARPQTHAAVSTRTRKGFCGWQSAGRECGGSVDRRR